MASAPSEPKAPPPRVSAVVPARDEAPRVGAVLTVLADHPEVEEIILVDDGSVDRTAQVAGGVSGVQVLRRADSGGKAAAVAIGVAATRGEVVLLLDADLTDLAAGHLDALLEPVLGGEADMTVGVFRAGRLGTDFAQAVAPGLSGQRAVRRDLLTGFRFGAVMGYGLETALNGHAEAEGWRVRRIPLRGVGQVTKEEKAGPVVGTLSRLRMYLEVAWGWLGRWTRRN